MMFVSQLSLRLFRANFNVALNTVRCFNFALGKTESELIEKWKRKFASEQISEVDESIKHILNHVQKEKQIALTKEQLNQFERLCECRLARMPIQYILGEWDFLDLTLKMVPPVFIPRSETEELVQLILQQCDDKMTMRFLEIGVGSGAISLAMLHSLPKAQAIAIDQSEYACKLTLENAHKLMLNDRIKVYKHKLTDDDSELAEVEGKLDLIVSNPPYVSNSELKKLAPEIRLYEDLRALDGGPDGMNVIKTILKFASDRLCLHGNLWMEIDSRHPKLIEKHLKDCIALSLKFIATYKDMYGKDRFVELMKI